MLLITSTITLIQFLQAIIQKKRPFLQRPPAPTWKKALIRFPQPSGSEGYIDESVGKPNIDELSKVKSLRHVQVIRGLSKYAIELDGGDALEVYYDTREDFIKINGTNATLTEDQQQVSSKRRYSVANFAIDLQ